MGKKMTALGQEAKMNLRDIKELIAILNKNGVSEFDLEQNGMHIRIVTGKANNRTPGEGKNPHNGSSGVIPQVISFMPAPTPASSGSSSAVAEAPPPKIEREVAPGLQSDSSGISVEEKTVSVKSPMVGTFYRSPAPDAPVYVDIGDEVSEDTVLCIVEAMKLMNEIKAELKGKIAQILVENGQPVEYGQPLFVIEPI
jgi:acetyl-CoA carboxylase biotin carboxyl carrier protein